jgi:hypothetical protein
VEEQPPSLILYNSNGEEIRRKVYSRDDRDLISSIFTTNPEDYSNLYLLFKNGRIEHLNEDFENTETIYVRGISSKPAYSADLDRDQEGEWIFLNQRKTGLVITRNDLSHPVELSFDIRTEYPRFSTKTQQDQVTHLAVQAEDTLYITSYQVNRIYWFRFLFYILIYTGILLFIILIRKLQQIQIRKRQAAEKELLELQLLTIKNQVDPHFTFNALNAINALILKEKKEDAYRFASKLSHLMRTALENSDKITTSLNEELDFIRNYLDLQRIRFRDSFDYQVIVDGRVDPAIQIPRHILLTYVENAVKHGLQPLEKGGFLWIKVERREGLLLHSVKDNGVGRAAIADPLQSTGKGLEIMKQIFTLYERLYHIAIEQEIVDLQDEDGRPAGTEVRIRIPER